MKAIFEGSPSDIRGVLADPTIAHKEAQATLRAETLTKQVQFLKDRLEETEQKLAASDRLIMDASRARGEAAATVHSIKNELGAKTAHIAAQDAKIQELQFEMRSLRNRMDDPIRLTAEQEEEIEKLYQQTVETYKLAPLFFSTGDGSNRISAEQWITGIFKLLATGNRVQAIRELRLYTGLSLVNARNLMDNALRAFGCATNDRGSPVTVVPVRSPVLKPDQLSTTET